ncbi:hypothetical protein K1719_031459 [Acacia pycnantha]|nr:hypothetical protein K1719_031459 [Acacia pycnantha]
MNLYQSAACDSPTVQNQRLSLFCVSMCTASAVENMSASAQGLEDCIKKDTAMDVPASLEARERISFLATSLFADMPNTRKVRNMLSFSVIIPHYIEDINLSWRSFVQIR